MIEENFSDLDRLTKFFKCIKRDSKKIIDSIAKIVIAAPAINDVGRYHHTMS